MQLAAADAGLYPDANSPATAFFAADRRGTGADVEEQEAATEDAMRSTIMHAAVPRRRVLELLRVRWRAGTLLVPTLAEIVFCADDAPITHKAVEAFWNVGTWQLLDQATSDTSNIEVVSRDMVDALRAVLALDAQQCEDARCGVVLPLVTMFTSLPFHKLVHAVSQPGGVFFARRGNLLTSAESESLRRLLERHAVQAPEQVSCEHIRWCSGACCRRRGALRSACVRAAGLRRARGARQALQAVRPLPARRVLLAGAPKEDWKRHKRGVDGGCKEAAATAAADNEA